MIKIENLSLSFDSKPFFQNLNLEIPTNQVTAIVGPNGAGKTTLLKILVGIIKPDEASITIDKKQTFYLPQKISYPTGITLKEYLSSIFFKNPLKWSLSYVEKEKINNILKDLELFDKKNLLIDKLSSGELQKANIALGLLSDAKIFLLDEPTSNLDLINQIKIMDMIKNLTSKGITCIIILHDLNLASSYSNFFIGINKNREIFTSDKNLFFKEEVLENIYNMKFRLIKDNENTHVQVIS